jgi:hypothetical protein
VFQQAFVEAFMQERSQVSHRQSITNTRFGAPP